MKGRLLLTVFIFIVTIVNAQNEYDLHGKGARAAGMAYAFNAIADDATGISWNPAGITQLKKPEIAFVNKLTLTDYKHPLWYNRSYQPVYTIDYMGFVYPLKLKKKDLVFGVSFQNNMNYKSVFSNTKSILSYYNAKNNLTINSISLCGAYSFTRFLAFGISVNKWFSLGNKSDHYTYYNTKEIDSAKYEYDENVIESNENFKYTGYNFSSGIMLDFASYGFPLRFALKYESKFVLKNNYDVTYRSDYIYENNITVSYLEVYKGTERNYIPGIVATGLSYRIGDYFTIACDFDIRHFKNSVFTWDYSYYNNFQDPPIDTVYNEVYFLLKSNENLNQFRIGLEYILHPKFALIPVRAGWKNNPTSISNYDENHEPFEQVFAHSLNFGLGLITKYYSLDLAYERYKCDRMDADFNNEKKNYYFFVLSANIFLR